MARDRPNERSTLVCESKIANSAVSERLDAGPWRSKRVRLRLDQHQYQQLLVLELWEATSDGDDDDDGDSAFMSFVGAVSVDLVEWRQTSAVQQRWYSLPSSQTTAWCSTNTEFEDSETQLQSRVTYIRVTRRTDATRMNKQVQKEKTAIEETAPEPTTEPLTSRSANDTTEMFCFVLPSQTIAHNRAFLTTRVGEILYEVVLHAVCVSRCK